MSLRHMVMMFHQTMGIPVRDEPGWPDARRVNLRMDLIEEEYSELVDAVCDGDLVAAADALADLAYVVEGMCLELGIDSEAVMRAVHAANMRKVGGEVREDGKILKPPGWVGPEAEIAKLLAPPISEEDDRDANAWRWSEEP